MPAPSEYRNARRSTRIDRSERTSKRSRVLDQQLRRLSSGHLADWVAGDDDVSIDDLSSLPPDTLDEAEEAL